MIKAILYLILLCLTGCVTTNEIYYIIRPSSETAPSSGNNLKCSRDAECMDTNLTLSQFVNNSGNYLTNNTRRVLSPGNYTLDLEFIVENVDSFSMISPTWFVYPPLSKAVVICGHNARLGFINVSVVTVSSLTFTGSFNNYTWHLSIKISN